jgi:hypothetical protein
LFGTIFITENTVEGRRREAAGVRIVVRAKRRAPLVEPEEVKEIV